MESVKKILREELDAFSSYTRNSALVNCVALKNALPLEISFLETNFSLPKSSFLSKLLQKANIAKKQKDIDLLCVSEGILNWKQNGIEVTTPILISSVDFKENKVTEEVFFVTKETLINPFIVNVLRTLELNDFPIYNEDSKANFLASFIEFLESKRIECTFSEDCFLGNFHYHSYFLLRDLEGLLSEETYSNPLLQLLGERIVDTYIFPDSNELIVPTDKDQEAVFAKIVSENTVLQGPPGTGKSQVILNLFAKAILNEESMLLVSEKKTALDVLVKKLNEIELARFATVLSSSSKASEIIAQLKQNWQFLENYSLSKKEFLGTHFAYFQQLEFLLLRLNQSDLIGEVSFSQFQKLSEEVDGITESVPFFINAPTIKECLENKETVQLLEQQFDLKILFSFSPSFFSNLENWSSLTEIIQLIKEYFNALEIDTFQDLERTVRLLPCIQIRKNTNADYLLDLAKSKRKYQLFTKSVKSYDIISETICLNEKENECWKVLPTMNQLNSFLNETNQWKKRRKRKVLEKSLKSKDVDLLIAIESFKKCQDIIKERNDLRLYFASINAPIDLLTLKTDILVLNRILDWEESITKEAFLLDKSKVLQLSEKSVAIEKVYRFVNQYFTFEKEENLLSFLNQKVLLAEKLTAHKTHLQLINKKLFPLFLLGNWEKIQAAVLHTNWQKMAAIFPSLSQFKVKDLVHLLEKNETAENTFFEYNSTKIHDKLKHRFTFYHSIIEKQLYQLSSSEKELRKRLKNGKRILVKEMAKSKQHISLRSLLESDASLWINVLIPVFFTTPSHVSYTFPLEKELFDLVVFDEASQLTLMDSLATVFRAKRVLIAGDSQQMSPKNQFTSNSVDLLHQANYYFTAKTLHHHYRSDAMDLIAFSNEHFYQNKLLVFPKPNVSNGITSIYVQEGRFIDQKNVQEAKEIARLLEQVDWSESIGIVAFSEEQLNCIWKECSAKVRLHIEQQEQNGQGFFLSLENVQGDEADQLFISLGYARNEEEKLMLRMGALTHSGGQKRLNVLLTRARKKIFFVHSIHAENIPITENIGINYLRKWLNFLTQPPSNSIQNSLPFGLKVSENDAQEIESKHLFAQIPDAKELLSCYRSFKKRGWKWSK